MGISKLQNKLYLNHFTLGLVLHKRPLADKTFILLTYGGVHDVHGVRGGDGDVYY